MDVLPNAIFIHVLEYLCKQEHYGELVYSVCSELYTRSVYPFLLSNPRLYCRLITTPRFELIQEQAEEDNELVRNAAMHDMVAGFGWSS